jgi:hypothetical protein
MFKPERSLFVFGLYLIVFVGLGFIFVPSFVLDVFGLKYGDDTWPRFVGLLASIIGVYYLLASRARLRPMFIWTVWMRYYAAAFMIALLIFGKVGSPILLFAAIDTAGATWTLWSLKK